MKRPKQFGLTADEHLDLVPHVYRHAKDFIRSAHEALKEKRCDIAIVNLASAASMYGRASAHQFSSRQYERYADLTQELDGDLHRLQRAIERHCRWTPTRP